ncbi:MAG: cell division protein ZapA [Candidatus Puniceispirillum sp.]|jgi:cell division protein ZapA|nr:cell division protein ZapA [Candidatus Puniceispirillum sp.]
MSQSVVTIRLNGNPYQIGCGAGEEAHVSKLGEEVESIMQSLIASVGQIGEARLLAMVALILADRAAGNADEPPLNGAADGAASGAARASAADHDAAAEALEMAAERIAALASRLTKP